MKVGQYNLCIFSDPDGLMIPYLTICPLPGFRKRGFFYSNADFRTQTFDLDEVFGKDTVKQLRNQVI